MLQDFANGDLKKITFDDVLDAAKRGDQISLDALKKVAYYLGIGIANLVNLFDVEVIVLGGVLSKACSLIISDIDQVVSSNMLDPEKDHLRIMASAHGADACVMGAIALVLDDFIREPAFS